MPVSLSSSQEVIAYRFHEFEVRIGDELLFHRGKQVRIQKLPFRMLLALLEKPNEVVLREELRSKIWGDTTFVDFDTNLRVAATKLREALGDCASDPVYLETVPKQGYKFLIEPVLELHSEEQSIEAAAEQVPAGLTEVPPVPVPKDKMRVFGRPSLYGLLTLAVFLTGLAFYGYWRFSRPLIHSEDSVVVGAFVNRTGSHDFDTGLTLPFRVKLEESSYLNLAVARQLARTSDVPTLSDELHACTAVPARVLLRGELIQREEQYAVRVSAWRCADGQSLASELAVARSNRDVLQALSVATDKMRRRLGEPESSILRSNIPLDQATSDSMGALRAYSLGDAKFRSGRASEAIPDLEMAIALDPKFTLAYACLGGIYAASGEVALSREYYRKAFNLRERATDRERFYIAAGYYSSATGQIWQAIKIYQLWIDSYPRDAVPVNNLVLEYLRLGQGEQAGVLARKAIQLNPQLEQPYALLARALSMSGDYEALAKLCRARAEKSNMVDMHLACYAGAFLRNDEASMQREMRWGQGKPLESTLLLFEAEIAASHGRLAESEHLFSQARENALHHDLTEFAAMIELEEAQLASDAGYPGKAKQHIVAALKMAGEGADVKAEAALVMARSGDDAGARAQARKAANLSPQDTLLNSLQLATVDAAIALAQHDPEKSIQSLQKAQPYELCPELLFSTVYYRGLAYLNEGQWQEAAAEFQKVLDHRSIYPASPYLSLSALQLAVAAEHAGDHAQAARAYHDAAENWKSADTGYLPLQRLRSFKAQLDQQ